MAKSKKAASQTKDYASLDVTELPEVLKTARKEHYVLQMKHSLGELKQPHLLRKSRRDIAKISTALQALSI